MLQKQTIFTDFAIFQQYLWKNSSADNPLAAGEQGDELRGHDAADERQQCNAGDGQGYGYQRFGLIASHENGGNVTQEEKMHQVHTERELRHSGNPTGSYRTLDAGEEQESSEGGTQHVGCAELPRPL